MSDQEVFERLSMLLGEGRPAVLCTLVEKRGSGPRDVGAKVLIDQEGKVTGTIGGGGMERRLVSEALVALREGRPRTVAFALGVEPEAGALAVNSKCGGEVKVFLDVIRPEPRLIIVGSGHIAKPLADFASRAGFEVVVVDDAETATQDRFPGMEVHAGPFEEELEGVEVRPSDFVAVVHGETRYEIAALRSVLRRKPAYIGLLGSRNKAREHKEQLLAEGFERDAVEAIRAPIGLEIGAETPEEIAVSILAELIMARRGRTRTA